MIEDEGMELLSHSQVEIPCSSKSPSPSKKRKLGAWLQQAQNVVSDAEPLRPRERLRNEIDQIVKPADSDPGNYIHHHTRHFRY